MRILKTLAISLIVGTALAASTLASMTPDHGAGVKSDLPDITTEMLPMGMDANPYPASYEADIALVSDEENCDEMEAFDMVAQVEELEVVDVDQVLPLTSN